MFDGELENFLADVEDVVSGRIVDMEHAELMAPLTEACTDLENELETFYRTSSRNAVINKMMVDELNKLIESLKSTTDFIRKLKSAVD
jgi:hypothetical protein